MLTSNETASWRADCPVLVSDVQTLGAIGVVRSLGRAGYPVHASAQVQDALGLSSRYARMRAVCPPYREPTFVPWLRAYVQRHGIKTLVPSEGLLHALRPHFAEFSPLLPFSSEKRVLYAGLRKHDLFTSLTNGAFPHLPPLCVARQDGELPTPAELASLGLPLFVKADHWVGERVVVDNVVLRCDTPHAARQQLSRMLEHHPNAIVQGHVPGQGVGVFALRWRGKLLAEFMHRRLHEVPYTGGVSSLRESWWHQGIRDDAMAKLDHLGWEGVAMLEYRYDARNDTYALIEMNGRFWGSLHLALYAGVDFPRLLLDAHQGHPAPPIHSFQRGLRCRHTFPGEIQHVWSVVRDAGVPWTRRVGVFLEFVRLTMDPRVYEDLAFPGDRSLFWRNLTRFSKEYGRLLLKAAR